MTEQEHTKDTVFQNGRAMIYRRVVQRSQTQSAQTQIESLIAFAIEQGFSNERILLFRNQRSLKNNRLSAVAH